MREIELRAWDKEQKRYFKVDTYSKEHLIDDYNSVHPTWVCIVEQYTGLKDKNGKKIYEGDIVNIIVVGEKLGKYLIYWDDELCEFGYKYCNELFHAQFYMDREVIGNIHENPELLA